MGMSCRICSGIGKVALADAQVVPGNHLPPQRVRRRTLLQQASMYLETRILRHSHYPKRYQYFDIMGEIRMG